MTTRLRISEAAERLFMKRYDREDIKPKIERREVSLLVDQATNELLSIRIQESMKVGIIEIPSCMIAMYPNITVDTTGGIYSIALPAFPIPLPMDMGVWNISPAPVGASYIPIRSDFWNLLAAEDEGLLEDGVGFQVKGRKVYFTKQPAATVNVELLITDPSLLSDHEPYPIPPDMELAVIERVVALLSQIGLTPDKAKG